MIGTKVKSVFGGKFTKGSRDPQNRMNFLLFPNKGCAPAPPYFGNYLQYFFPKNTQNALRVIFWEKENKSSESVGVGFPFKRLESLWEAL